MPTKNEKNGVLHSRFAVATKDNTAEIKMYGEIVRAKPVDWWGDPIDGEFIIGSEVISQLEKLEDCKKINIRIDSLGGEVCTALRIHNRLREMAVNGIEITCTVDGVAMSAGTIIMCAADKVVVSSSSMLMIHKSMGYLYGYYNADELEKEKGVDDKYDKAMVATYIRKTGKSEQELLDMMSETIYMTGDEAVEKGFADELMEQTEEKVKIVACADRSALMIRGSYFPLHGAKCPENIKAIKSDSAVTDSDVANKNTEGKLMAENLEQLRSENPKLAETVEKEIKAELVKGENTAAEVAAKKAVEDERRRLAEIDEISALFGEDLVKEAKYGEKACTAAELAYRAAKESAKSGEDYFKKMQEDTNNSNANSVTAVVAPEIEKTGEKTDKEKMDEARSAVKSALGKEEQA